MLIQYPFIMEVTLQIYRFRLILLTTLQLYLNGRAEPKSTSLMAIRRMKVDNLISIQTSKRKAGSSTMLSHILLGQEQCPLMPSDHWNQLITVAIFQIRKTQHLQRLRKTSDRIAGDHKPGYY